MSRYSHLYANTDQDLRVIAEMDAEAIQANRAERRRIAADTLWPEAIQAEADRIPPAPGPGTTFIVREPVYSARRVARWREEEAIVQAVARLVVGLAILALICVGWSALPA